MAQSTTKFLDVHVAERMSREAAAAVTANRLVAIDGTDHTKAAQLTGANALADGVAEDDVAVGKQFSIATGGRLSIMAGATIVPGDELVSDSSGRVVPRVTTPATALQKVVGRALTAAAIDELVMVKWGPYSVWAANAS